MVRQPFCVVVYTRNISDQITSSGKQACRKDNPLTQLSEKRNQLVNKLTLISESGSENWTLNEVLSLTHYTQTPELLTSSHPFNKPFYLKSFIGHLYRKYIKDSAFVTSETDIFMNFREYKLLLNMTANENRTVIIVTVDLAFVDMAINMFETSFRKFNITNYVFVCSQPLATDTLLSNGINAITLWKDDQGDKKSDYSSKAFNRKTRYKTLATTLALSLGFTVLLMDVDIIFLKNPFPFLTCDSCDIIFQSEGAEWNPNTGFYLAFPTNSSLKLHLLALDSYKLGEVFNDQDAIHYIVQDMKDSAELRVKFLNRTLFPNGVRYFEDGCRMFAGDHNCQDCVIVHNNDIISYSNKVYRFKEHLMWFVDSDGYYSNKQAKYIIYQNSLKLKSCAETRKVEINSLKTALALGHLLNRIVILPKFHCSEHTVKRCFKPRREAWCNIQEHLNMTKIDRELPDKYREQTFLSHDKVPDAIKKSVSELLLVKTLMTDRVTETKDFKAVKYVYTPNDETRGATQEELVAWMKEHEKYSVLRFHSLYGQVIDPTELLIFDFKLRGLS